MSGDRPSSVATRLRPERRPGVRSLGLALVALLVALCLAVLRRRRALSSRLEPPF